MKKILYKAIIILYILSINSKILALDINSKYAVLYNLNDDEIIYAKNENEKIKVASLTKIMTALVALENINDIKDNVVVPKEAFNNLDGYVKAGFKANETVTYEDLLYGIMLPSGAECANAIAITIGGNIDNFVEMMNEKAKSLNLENTHFSNPIGKDEDNYSSVSDIAKILKYALKNETFYKIFTTKEYITTNKIKLITTINERSEKYNLDTKTILGSKTGFTDEAGFCLASIANINNIKYLLVTAKADTNLPYQIIDAASIYNYYKDNYSYRKILTYNDIIATLKIKNKKEEYKVYSQYDKYVYLNNEIDLNKLEYKYEGVKELNKKIKKNDYLGKVKITYENKVLYEYPIYLKEKIIYYDYIYILTPLLILIIAIILVYKKKHK